MFVGIREVEIFFLTNIGLLAHARAPRWNKREQHATGSFWPVESISGVFGVLGYKCPILLGERTRHVQIMSHKSLRVKQKTRMACSLVIKS